jgi:signal transduction histidine kinase
VSRRIVLLVCATMAVVLLAFVIPLGILVRVLAADRATAAATGEAQQLSAVVATLSGSPALRASVTDLVTAAGRRASVFLPDGTVLGSPAAQTAEVRLAEHGQSMTVADDGGRDVLVAVQSNGGTAVILVYASHAELVRGVVRAWLILIGFGLALLGLGVLVASRLASTMSRPVAELAWVSHQLAAGDLYTRAWLTGPPEIREMARSLNHLADRIRDLVWQERESVADLSHRLRTPLTALRLEAEAIAPAADPEGRLTALVQAMEDTVTGLIEDSRGRTAGPASCDAVQVVRERAAFWSVLADDQGRAMTVELADGPVPVGVAGADLAACLDALLGNVFAHTPQGAGLLVRLARGAAGGGLISVADTGPGFADPDPVRRGASGGGSTGLGLDIARRTAEASGGSLTVRNEVTGGHVIVELGPPRPR